MKRKQSGWSWTLLVSLLLAVVSLGVKAYAQDGESPVPAGEGRPELGPIPDEVEEESTEDATSEDTSDDSTYGDDAPDSPDPGYDEGESISGDGEGVISVTDRKDDTTPKVPPTTDDTAPKVPTPEVVPPPTTDDTAPKVPTAEVVPPPVPEVDPLAGVDTEPAPAPESRPSRKKVDRSGYGFVTSADTLHVVQIDLNAIDYFGTAACKYPGFVPPSGRRDVYIPDNRPRSCDASHGDIQVIIDLTPYGARSSMLPARKVKFVDQSEDLDAAP